MTETPTFYRYKFVLEFFGAGLVGWQRQNVGRSVQGILTEAARKFCHETIIFQAAGRTDAGVHARGMVCHGDFPADYPAYKVMDALNYHLKHDPVSILAASRVSADFEARFSALRRYYRYHIINRRAPLTFQAGRAWHVKFPLDEARMQDAARILVGHHDFTTFRSVECQAKSPLKTLDRLDVWREGDNIYIDAVARSFLHHQVRSMVGSLCYVGRGKWTVSDLKKSLEARNRRALAHNAPSEGLYFMKVDY